LNKWLAFIPWRRATTLTGSPEVFAASTIASFSASVQRRLGRLTPVTESRAISPMAQVSA
jgi:hypothetical protein